jgi:hypothetical protein
VGVYGLVSVVCCCAACLPSLQRCVAAVIFFVCACLAANQSAAHKEGGCRTPLHMQACQNFISFDQPLTSC